LGDTHSGADFGAGSLGSCCQLAYVPQQRSATNLNNYFHFTFSGPEFRAKSGV
jgi:hypothetical protein